MSNTSARSVLLTGGAGFIGVNVAAHLARTGWQVTILDHLSRAGTEANLRWLQQTFPDRVEFVSGDVRNVNVVNAAVTGRQAVIHLAAQVAVTTSMVDPRADFEVNAFGTMNILEAVRLRAPDAVLLFASTNKVYGSLEGWPMKRVNDRWEPADGRVGVAETEALDFYSPYGCSKGAADQYVQAYARCFGLRTVVLRQSCIYGEHQFGNEDQGWVAHFAHSVVDRRPITIYGDGHQSEGPAGCPRPVRIWAATLSHSAGPSGSSAPDAVTEAGVGFAWAWRPDVDDRRSRSPQQLTKLVG
jgi:CDP-paratose 2-epimerase